MRSMGSSGIAVLAALGIACQATLGALPGVWAEFERGGWHHDAKDSAAASGGKRVSWFDNTERANYVSFDLAEAMPKAVLFVRYSRVGQGDGALGISFGPAQADTKPQAIPETAALRLRPTGSFDKYAWVSLPLGDLPAGKQMLVVRCLANGAGADLDVAGLAPDDPESRWLPPNECKDGMLIGPGELGAAPRPDDRADVAAIRAEAAAIAEREKPFLSSDVPILTNTYRTSWLGNSEAVGGRGAGKWVQNQIFALHVRPNGTVYANSPWDEGGRECGIYKDGKVLGGLEKTHDVLAGYAIASDGTYVYAAIKSGFIRRYSMDGKLAPFAGGERGGADLYVGGVIQGPQGLAIVGDELFVSLLAVSDRPPTKAGGKPASASREDPVASDGIVALGLTDLKVRRTWDVPRCRQLAADPAGTIWAIQAGTTNARPAVLHFTSAGQPLPQRIENLVEPSALTVDVQGRLLVAENGPDQQVRIYDVSAAPKLVGTFGVKGGVFAEPRGAMGPDRLYGITALACDPAGNLYVNCNGWDWSGSDLRCFGPDGALKWQLQGLFFVDSVDADPADETQVFGVQERFELEYDAPAGKGWKHVDYTLDPFRYPEDPRVNGAKGSSVRMHRIGGQRFMSIGEMPGSLAILYRFDGRIAVPCVMFRHAQGTRKGGEWPPNAPDTTCWLWRDANADGRFQADEFQAQPFKRDGIAGLFDVSGDYWQPTWSEKIRHYPCKGLDANGVPQYDAEPASVADRPGDFKDMERIEYIPPADTMFISGYTERWPAKDKHFIPAGSVIAAYPRWNEGNRVAKWVTPIPYSQNPYAIPKSMSAAGDYVFVFYAGVEQIVIVDARDGKVVGRLVPGPEIGGTHGDADIPWAVKAIQRKDGSYAVFVEDDRYAKQVLYLWKP